jgi:hypothetical protein
MPFSDHLVGLKIHQQYKLPWIAHFADAWIDNPFLKFTGQEYKYWSEIEKDVISEADALVFVSRQLANLVMRKYPAEWGKKVRVISNAFDLDILETFSTNNRIHNRLRLIYTGSFYGIRTPLPLYNGLQTLNKEQPIKNQVQVILIGNIPKKYLKTAEQMGLDEIVEFPGDFSYLDSQKMAAKADVLLVIDANTSPELCIFLPSKLIDYLMFRKPILGITPYENPSAKLLRQLDCPVVAPEDIKGVAMAISDLLKRRKCETLRISPDHENTISQFNINQTVGDFHNVLIECIN